MPESQSHYEVLGVRPMADAQAIKRAYREKIREVHPDRFASEAARLRREGDTAGLRALERRIEEAKKRTQRINEAYAVLSDPERRELYDQMRSARSSTGRPRTTQASRPHRSRVYEQTHARTEPYAPPTPPRKNDRVPVLLIIIFFAILVGSFSFLSNLLQPGGRGAIIGTFSTPETRIPVGSVDATSTAAASQPTATPRSPADNITIGDRLFSSGNYALAIEPYSAAIDAEPDNAAFFIRRGRAYAALANEALDADAEDAAFADFGAALRLDATAGDAYCARGLLYYERWQRSGESAAANAALGDLVACEMFAAGGAPDSGSVSDAISDLREDD